MSPALKRSSALQHIECSTWNKRWNNIHETATYVKKQIFGFCEQHGSLVHEQWCWYQLMCVINHCRQHRLSLVHKPMIYHVRVTIKPNTWNVLTISKFTEQDTTSVVNFFFFLFLSVAGSCINEEEGYLLPTAIFTDLWPPMTHILSSAMPWL